MKRLFPFLALAVAITLPPVSADRPTEPEPGYYEGARISFRLQRDGDIRNLRIQDQLIAHDAGQLRGRRFHFNVRTGIFRFEGDGYWDSPTRCEGDYLHYVPSVSGLRPARFTWQARKERDDDD